MSLLQLYIAVGHFLGPKACGLEGFHCRYIHLVTNIITLISQQEVHVLMHSMLMESTEQALRESAAEPLLMESTKEAHMETTGT